MFPRPPYSAICPQCGSTDHLCSSAISPTLTVWPSCSAVGSQRTREVSCRHHDSRMASLWSSSCNHLPRCTFQGKTFFGSQHWCAAPLSSRTTDSSIVTGTGHHWISQTSSWVSVHGSKAYLLNCPGCMSMRGHTEAHFAGNMSHFHELDLRRRLYLLCLLIPLQCLQFCCTDS